MHFNCEGPWKRVNLAVDGNGGGVVTQCISPKKMNDQYFTNLLLKINAKVHEIEHFLKKTCLSL